ncbi:hypothetical protein EV421DRAFT_2000713 [Armillaria borealis]|uniref:Uncharacterized protein n=1 Tax=Armillaria borealis TaxID=47425 RepID=A0AA39MG31_9AGAR|nr:hypothetical protein EV421DRAFT_2000713 [Armillaria borealis]
MPASDLPPELLDIIIDELQDDEPSLLEASLAFKALYPRTRVHLFRAASLDIESSCDRLRELITLSPKLALHFKSLDIEMINGPEESICIELTVIESLVNLTHLSLIRGYWHHLPDTVVSSLQSCSYLRIDIGSFFEFRSMGNICSLVQNSPDLQQVRFTFRNDITDWEECDLNHSFPCIPAPVALYINTSENFPDPVETVLKWATLSRPCRFSFRDIHKLDISLPDRNPDVLPHLGQYLTLLGTSLKHLCVRHGTICSEYFLDRYYYTPIFTLDTGLPSLASETLSISSIEQITVTMLRMTPLILFGRVSRIFEWWISNLSAVNEHCVIRSITFKVITMGGLQEEHPASSLDDVWTRLDGCLASYKMASLERVAITFVPRPAEWDTFKAHMEGNFLSLRQLGREVVLDAVSF